MTRDTIIGTLQGDSRLSGDMSIGGGTTDYEELENKPSINGVELAGNVTFENLGIWQPKNFSTEEQNTGLKWIDGKDIYFKTLTFTLGNTNVMTLDNVTQYSEIINIIGNIHYSNNYMDLIPYSDNSDYCLIRLNSGSLEYAISNYFKNNGTVRATVFYTKN